MLKYSLKRILNLVPVLLGITFLTFILTYIAPSDPAEMYFMQMGVQPTEEALSSMRQQLGLNQPVIAQYAGWLINVLHGDLGTSVKYGKPVMQVINERLPYTILLAVVSFILMILLSLPLAVLSVVNKDKAADYIIRGLSFVGISMPSFWLGMLLIYFFSVKMKWLPSFGTNSWKNIILPAFTLAISMASMYIRRIRAAMLEELEQDYVIGARSRGISKKKIILLHILPNSLLTIVTMMGMSFGYLLGGTMIVETVFSWNGIGKMAADSITSRDYSLIQGYVMWLSIIYVAVNLLVDLLYHYLDPRIRLGDISYEK